MATTGHWTKHEALLRMGSCVTAQVTAMKPTLALVDSDCNQLRDPQWELPSWAQSTHGTMINCYFNSLSLGLVCYAAIDHENIPTKTTAVSPNQKMLKIASLWKDPLLKNHTEGWFYTIKHINPRSRSKASLGSERFFSFGQTLGETGRQYSCLRNSWKNLIALPLKIKVKIWIKHTLQLDLLQQWKEVKNEGAKPFWLSL